MSTKKPTKKKRTCLNKQRNKRYKDDAAYRTVRQERSRETYRKNVGGVETTDCRKNIKNLDKLGALRVVRLGRIEVKAICFTKRQLAEAFNIKPLTMYKWVGGGRIPEPVFKLVYADDAKVNGENAGMVYHRKEVRAMLDVVGEHQSQYAHYRETHTETIAAVKAAINKARKEIRNGNY